ncbi:hypothetical protein AB4099_09955 [Bosea sp. 2KB_26]|uniref:hypothetical protein n=1 Tax=Bosea sp. 2KB_26 TaxID=3237475 RepID=UPI000DE25F59
MSTLKHWSLAFALLGGVASWTGSQPAAAQTVIVAGVGPAAIDELNVKVAAVDRPNRTMIVQQRSHRWLVEVPEVFGDLSKVKVGDNLEIRRIDGAIAAVTRGKKGLKPGIRYSEGKSDAVFQNLPSRFVTRTATVTAKFNGFDPAKKIVTIDGPDGRRSLPVADPTLVADLQKLKRGDMIELVFTEAFQVTLK